MLKTTSTWVAAGGRRQPLVCFEIDHLVAVRGDRGPNRVDRFRFVEFRLFFVALTRLGGQGTANGVDESE